MWPLSACLCVGYNFLLCWCAHINERYLTFKFLSEFEVITRFWGSTFFLPEKSSSLNENIQQFLSISILLKNILVGSVSWDIRLNVTATFTEHYRYVTSLDMNN
jgi:hypothetical protein